MQLQSANHPKFRRICGVSEIAKTGLGNHKLPKTPLFGTDGIRGKAGELLNAPFAVQLGYSAGKVWQETARDRGPVIIGQDSRNSSDMLAMAMSSGLTAIG